MLINVNLKNVCESYGIAKNAPLSPEQQARIREIVKLIKEYSELTNGLENRLNRCPTKSCERFYTKRKKEALALKRTLESDPYNVKNLWEKVKKYRAAHKPSYLQN